MKKSLIGIIIIIMLGIITSMIILYNLTHNPFEVDSKIPREAFGVLINKEIKRKEMAKVYYDPIDIKMISRQNSGLIDNYYLIFDGYTCVLDWNKEQIKRFNAIKAMPTKIYFRHSGNYIQVDAQGTISNYLVVKITLPTLSEEEKDTK